MAALIDFAPAEESGFYRAGVILRMIGSELVSMLQFGGFALRIPDGDISIAARSYGSFPMLQACQFRRGN